MPTKGRACLSFLGVGGGLRNLCAPLHPSRVRVFPVTTLGGVFSCEGGGGDRQEEVRSTWVTVQADCSPAVNSSTPRAEGARSRGRQPRGRQRPASSLSCHPGDSAGPREESAFPAKVAFRSPGVTAATVSTPPQVRGVIDAELVGLSWCCPAARPPTPVRGKLRASAARACEGTRAEPPVVVQESIVRPYHECAGLPQSQRAKALLLSPGLAVPPGTTSGPPNAFVNEVYWNPTMLSIYTVAGSVP